MRLGGQRREGGQVEVWMGGKSRVLRTGWWRGGG